MILGTEATPCLAPAAENSTIATFTGRCSAAAFTTTRREPEYRQVTAPTVAAAAPNRNTRRVTFPVRSSLANPPSNIARILIQTIYIQRASPKPRRSAMHHYGNRPTNNHDAAPFPDDPVL